MSRTAGYRLSVTAKPGASKSGVTGRLADGSLGVSVRAAAREGKANEELVRVVARAFGVPRGSVSLLRGAASRKKVLVLTSVSEEEGPARLARVLAGTPSPRT